MKKRYCSVFAMVFLAFAGLADAQSSVDKKPGVSIVGKWTFDSKKSSEQNPEHKGEMLVITYDDPTLTIERSLTLKKETKTATIVLFTDKRGEKNRPFPFDPGQELSSTTEWQDKTLVRLYNMERVGKPSNILRMKESYELKDGGNLLVVTDRPLPGTSVEGLDPVIQRRMIIKRVYRRVV